MSEPETPPAAPALQFDRAVSEDTSPTGGVACSKCGRAITQSYFNLDQLPYCGPCKLGLERAQSQTLTAAAFVKASVFGLGAALAGAAVYYAVIAITHLEIGLVAILIGYMVGYAVRAATRGGGRRYQVLAGALTYFAVALAYLPLAIKGAMGEGRASASAQHAGDSTRIALRDTTPAATDSAAADSVAAADSAAPVTQAGRAAPVPVRQVSFGKAALTVIVLVLALPVMIVFGSLPMGLISGLIIGFGIRRAWQMTAATRLAFDGPLKVAPVAPPPA